MAYMPAVASLAAANKDKIKNIRTTILCDTKEEKKLGVVIMNFESETLNYDKKQIDRSGATGTYTCAYLWFQFILMLVQLSHSRTLWACSYIPLLLVLGNHILKYATLGNPYNISETSSYLSQS